MQSTDAVGSEREVTWRERMRIHKAQEQAIHLGTQRLYSDTGDEVEAKRIHYVGRCDLREQAKTRDGTINWPRRSRWGDWWLKWLTGYGVQTWRLLGPICLFVIL